MTPFDIARSYIGTTEGPGPADNPVIMEMYASVGHDWVEHDETAWCAAFVGHCLEKAGIRSTRALNARSYLGFGEPVQRGGVGERHGDGELEPAVVGQPHPAAQRPNDSAAHRCEYQCWCSYQVDEFVGNLRPRNAERIGHCWIASGVHVVAR